MTRLLHTDDDQSWREMFAEVADDLGLQLDQCSTRDQALAAIQRLRPDIVVTDLHLGEKDQSGYEIARTAIENGVTHVAIASETLSPSQKVGDVPIMDKKSALHWLKDISQRGTER